MSTTTKAKYFYGVGRRKASSARAKITPGGDLKLSVNKKEANVYFPEYYYQTLTTMLHKVGITTGTIDLFINGGGVMGQAEAARLAIAKALVTMDEGLRPIIRMNGYITTDIRKVLPKRPGLRKARKREQWSKR